MRVKRVQSKKTVVHIALITKDSRLTTQWSCIQILNIMEVCFSSAPPIYAVVDAMDAYYRGGNHLVSI